MVYMLCMIDHYLSHNASWSGVNILNLQFNCKQCCQCFVSPAQLGYFASGRKNYWAGGLKLGYFPSVYPQQFFSPSNLPVSCQIREFFWAFSMAKNILFINLSISIIHFMRKTTFNCVSTQLGDSDYFMAEKHNNLGKWAYDYLIKKVGLLLRCLPWAKKPICPGLALGSFGNTGCKNWIRGLDIGCQSRCIMGYAQKVCRGDA